jgi:3-oxoacyl-[acyl-carrier protein] reductase
MCKRALVTGGSGSIGAAICQRLAADGFDVIIHTHRNLTKATALAVSIRDAGGRAVVSAFDITDRETTTQAVQELIVSGPIQVLVNNAGIHDDAAFPGLSPQQWQEVIDVSLNGFFHVTQAVLMPMIRTRWGRIINITSVAALMGNRGQVNYAAAKGALHAATKSLALEVANRGITVNAVAPGIIATEMSAQAFDAARITQVVPMGRAGQPAEVADLVGFLASEKSAYISGQIISVNGAMV